MRAGRAAAGCLALVTVAVAGCSQPEPPPDEKPVGTSADGPSSHGDPTAALRERCRSALPEDAPVTALDLAEGTGGGPIEAARFGPATSARAVVLLPQVSGLCGWGRWATAAADGGVTSIAVNPCGYGRTECTEAQDADPLHEVAVAVEVARREVGAERVALVGTSMGGSLTVMAVAAGADVDAWADLSGPSAWDGTRLRSLAEDLRTERGDGMIVMSRADGREPFTSARSLARAAEVPFIPAASGHGWELLNDPVDGSLSRLGRLLLRFVLDGSTASGP